MTEPARPDGAPPATTTIVEALDKNKNATEAVKEAADDLLVVHAVLKEEIPDEARTGPVGQAVEHTRDVEKRLSDSADLLEDVNTSLEQELERRDEASRARRPIEPRTALRAAKFTEASVHLHGKQGAEVRAQCSSVALIENSSGRWRELHVFRLSRDASG